MRFSISAFIYWQNPCKLLMSFRCLKAIMHAFSGMFSRASLEGISFKFFVCFIFNVSLGSAPKRKNFDIQRNTRVGSGGQFTSNRLSCHHILLFTYQQPCLAPNSRRKLIECAYLGYWSFSYNGADRQLTMNTQNICICYL